jgi:hypothetical protein
MLSCVVGGSAGSRQACVLAWRSAGSSGQLPLWRHQRGMAEIPGRGRRLSILRYPLIIKQIWVFRKSISIYFLALASIYFGSRIYFLIYFDSQYL